METGVFGCDDVTMMTLNIISPLDFSAPCLDNLDGITIWDSREWDTRNFYCYRLLSLTYTVFIHYIDEALVVGCDLAPDVVDHPLLDSHYILIIHPSSFDIE